MISCNIKKEQDTQAGVPHSLEVCIPGAGTSGATRIYYMLILLGVWLPSVMLAQHVRVKHPEGRVVTYNAPEGAALSDQYTVTVNGTPVDVYIAPVWEPHYTPKVKPFGGPYSFAYFDFTGPVKVEIRSRKPLEGTRILPESRGIRPDIAQGTITFVLTEPGQLSIEPDAKNGPLLLFANPLESNPPHPGDPDVIYFGPGVHEAGAIEVKDGQTLYIAGGAVVKGGVHARGKGIRIRGRGILDGLDWEFGKGPTPNLLHLTKCTDIKIEGIILKDSWHWTFPMYGCQGVHIDNVKIVSARIHNNDGIGICNSQDVKIENCFIRTDDDCITTKGVGIRQEGSDSFLPVEDVLVERCVLWTDRAHIWRLGCESRASTMRRLVFRNIDVLHYTDPNAWVISVQPAEGMLMEDVRFENIRINGEGQPNFIEVMTRPTKWAKQQTPGMVRNVLFKDIVLEGDAGNGLVEVSGSDHANTAEGVVFENVVRYGRRLTSDAPHITIGEHTKNVVFR